jgi:hypothetical protein
MLSSVLNSNRAIAGGSGSFRVLLRRPIELTCMVDGPRIGPLQRRTFRWRQVLASATDGGCSLTSRTLDSIAGKGVALGRLSRLSTPGPTASTCFWIPSGFCVPVKAWAARIRSCVVHYELLQVKPVIMRKTTIAKTEGGVTHFFHNGPEPCCNAFGLNKLRAATIVKTPSRFFHNGRAFFAYSNNSRVQRPFGNRIRYSEGRAAGTHALRGLRACHRHLVNSPNKKHEFWSRFFKAFLHNILCR